VQALNFAFFSEDLSSLKKEIRKAIVD